VTIVGTVADEVCFYLDEDGNHNSIDLRRYADQGRICIEDVPLANVKSFISQFSMAYQAELHDGERETLAFLWALHEEWRVCAADKAVFRTLGVLGRGHQGISLEELLARIGMGRPLQRQFSRDFRDFWTSAGQKDSIQDRGFS